ncbi:MAG: glutamyl-tRNA reductase [Magnetococcales bacterium]|nr:glutamyl-tRNA reductase [Magnetococcales bacterium]NGZ26000.1 glutamyl-tRNA reductase [Magnetococcales bacterium]
MKLAVIGISHKTAPIALREKLAFAGDGLVEQLAQLVTLPLVSEAAILSTCNRVEIYFATNEPEEGTRQVIQWLADHHGLNVADILQHTYQFSDEGAVRHGFRVASSLDSLVLGEPQILGQMKQAFQTAFNAGTTRHTLNRYFHRAFQVAKRVRSETAIAENPVSIAYAAVELARKIFGNLNNHTCLLVGAGEMCELAARHLVTHGIKQVLVTNRTYSRAVRLASEFDGQAFPMEELPSQLERADIILSSTGATTFVITPPMVSAALKRRRQKPMFFIDIAVPRDIDPQVGKLDSAFLYDIDDLNQIVENNRKERGQAAAAAEAIVAQETPEFLSWQESLSVVPAVVALRQYMEGIRDEELTKAFASWSTLPPQEQEKVAKLTRLIINKILHTPTSRLKSLSTSEDAPLYVETLRRLFNLP